MNIKKLLGPALMSTVMRIHKTGGKTYAVGGFVRDHFMGLPYSDIDLVVTGVREDVLTVILETTGEVDNVGKSFGVLKYRGSDGRHCDIALPRVEVSTGPGHTDFDIEADHTLPIGVDLGRRDFTINAIAIDVMTGDVTDPYGGRDDLNARHLRMVFSGTFVEDPLRVLRAAQFAARFGLVVDGKTMDHILDASRSVGDVSGERISAELRKMIMSPKPSRGFDVLRDVEVEDKSGTKRTVPGALRYILPELHALVGVEQPRKYHSYDAYDHTMVVLDAAADMGFDHNMRLVALFHDLGKATTKNVEADGNIHFYGHQFESQKLARGIGKRLRLRSAGFDMDLVETMCRHHMEPTNDFRTDKSLRRFVQRVGGPDNAVSLCNFRIADKKGGAYPDRMDTPIMFRHKILGIINAKDPLSVRDLAIGGHELMEMGLAGRNIGDTLKYLLDKVMGDPDLNNQESLLKLAKRREQ